VPGGQGLTQRLLRLVEPVAFATMGRRRYLTETIRGIYQRSRSTYGAPRVHGQLCRIGTRVGRKRVARLMADADLVGVHSRKKWRRGRLDVAPAPDLLERTFSATAPNERWVADITEFMTGEGKIFLAGVRDLCGRGLVGWSMGNRQTSELVIEAVSMALARREPGDDVVHHSDKGCQGEFSRSSQHLSVRQSLEARRGLRMASSSRGSCEALC
jgi:transposase InsO family protein